MGDSELHCYLGKPHTYHLAHAQSATKKQKKGDFFPEKSSFSPNFPSGVYMSKVNRDLMGFQEIRDLAAPLAACWGSLGAGAQGHCR